MDMETSTENAEEKTYICEDCGGLALPESALKEHSSEHTVRAAESEDDAEESPSEEADLEIETP